MVRSLVKLCRPRFVVCVFASESNGCQVVTVSSDQARDLSEDRGFRCSFVNSRSAPFFYRYFIQEHKKQMKHRSFVSRETNSSSINSHIVIVWHKIESLLTPEITSLSFYRSLLDIKTVQLQSKKINETFRFDRTYCIHHGTAVVVVATEEEEEEEATEPQEQPPIHFQRC